MAIIYPNHSGVYLFDGNMNLIEKRLFSKNELIEKCLALERNEWLEEEKELIELIGNRKGEKAFLLGFKKEKLQNVVLTQDLAKLQKASEAAGLETLHENSIEITKKKLKNAVGKDWLIMHASEAIEDLNRASNLIAKRLREWYELYNPEFSRAVEDHEKFAELITSKSKAELLRSIGLSEDSSMGADLGSEDTKAMLILAEELKSAYATREKEKEYLEELMQQTCPNLKAVAGMLTGAKLIAIAGSLKKLSEMPASTIQVLGAERALFRHKKTGAKAPKFGVIRTHQLVQGSGRENQGKAARALSDKIAIAAKIDYFKGSFIGDKLAAGLEKRFA